jgi:hypothetical protein
MVMNIDKDIDKDIDIDWDMDMDTDININFKDLECAYWISVKSLIRIQHISGLRRLQSDISGSDFRLSPILFAQNRTDQNN